MFSHPSPGACASDASRIHVFVGERDASCLHFFTLFYLFTLVYSFCMLKRVTNVGIPTFLLTLLHLFLSLEGRAPSKILPNRWNHWDSLHFFKFAKVQWCECVRFGNHGYASWKDDPMSGRRKFGSVLVRSARDGHKYVQARYQPPAWAYSKWPDLPRHYTKNFDADYTAMAEAWLA